MLKFLGIVVSQACTILVVTFALCNVTAAQDRDVCFQRDGDRSVDACSRLIEAGQLTGTDLATIYVLRGSIYRTNQQYDLAIGDLTHAIDILKNSASNSIVSSAFVTRASVYVLKGDLPDAFADYREALTLDPSNVLASEGLRTTRLQMAAAPRPATPPSPPSIESHGTAATAYQALTLFGDVFERIRNDYAVQPDDWALAHAAIQGLLKTAGMSATAIDEKQLCAKERTSPSATGALLCFGAAFEVISQSGGKTFSYVDLVDGAIASMVSSLDAHSSYMNAKDFRNIQLEQKGQIGGTGIELINDNGLMKVTYATDGAPAARAGIRTNDVVSTIDDEAVAGLTVSQVLSRLRGPLNSAVRIGILRKGTEGPVDIRLVRETIIEKPVRSHAIGGGIGYIRILRFDTQTTDGLRAAVNDIARQLGQRAIDGFILDLRGNPGGLLDQALSVSDAFLDRGEIVSTRGRQAEMTQRFNAKPGDIIQKKPLIVLINGTSAGASEIVAAALQDQRRATILGTRSFGEGSIQTVVPLGAGQGALRLTTSLFYRPSGQTIQLHGVIPDIEVQQNVPENLKDISYSEGEAALLGRLNVEGLAATGSQTYVPPDERDDKALAVASKLLRGEERNPAFPPKESSAH